MVLAIAVVLLLSAWVVVRAFNEEKRINAKIQAAIETHVRESHA